MAAGLLDSAAHSKRARGLQILLLGLFILAALDTLNSAAAVASGADELCVDWK